ncbi:hypothetical protein TWF173_005566 [Orbilia oligospora]|uniref:Uncharacterized protein n=2 Tax=Orbilia oligospora TaxID=2813651 RepID=G1XDF0_ARTOA|nr:hypothetical protein AOL_s00079g335 [Orbilia oligospora ATCC 24927]EGX48696.1 hypothetical protein AOL_s00079g335 [Orbilia oligospora ATCC 24927]KAF3287446.1 hypothetical protein TWF970_007171 [Orbilia oligospora]KAF3313974.1 hypothetical protein TWF173_005566 [Orbilia oligospora]
MKFTLVAFVSVIGLVAASPAAFPNPMPFYESEPEAFSKLAKRDCTSCINKIRCCAFPPNVNYCHKC